VRDCPKQYFVSALGDFPRRQARKDARKALDPAPHNHLASHHENQYIAGDIFHFSA
jgi:hypothetical protein